MIIKNTNENKPLVSAIVSTFKSERFIRGKIEDLLNQTIAKSLEIIIVNSGSPQNEDSIIKEYLPDNPNIKYIHTEERETVYKAWNRGIKAASGKYITNSNTDDRLKKDALEIFTGILEQNSDVALLWADQVYSKKENETFDETAKDRIIKFPDYDFMQLLSRCIVGSQPIWRASLHFEDNIWFDDRFEALGDHDFELSVAQKYRLMHISKPLGVFYKSPLRSNKEYENIARNRQELNIIRDKHIGIYIDRLTEAMLDEKLKEFKKYIIVPFWFYMLMAKILDIIYRKRMYRPILPYSIEFISQFVKMAELRKSNDAAVMKIEQRILRYNKIKNIALNIRNILRGISV